MSGDQPQLTSTRPTMNEIFQTFAMQALVACGKLPNPLDHKIEVDLLMAEYHIGVLELLWEKTRGRLSDEEARGLEELMHQVHIAFVDARGAKS